MQEKRIFKLESKTFWFFLFFLLFWFFLLFLLFLVLAPFFDGRFVIQMTPIGVQIKIREKTDHNQRSCTHCSRVQGRPSPSICSVVKNLQVSSLSSSCSLCSSEQNSVCQLITAGDSCDSLPAFLHTKECLPPPNHPPTQHTHSPVRKKKKKTARKKITRMRNSNCIFSTLAAVCLCLPVKQYRVEKRRKTRKYIRTKKPSTWRQSAKFNLTSN